jgi:hypothetical protein
MELLTIPEAARRINKTPASLYAAIDRGALLTVEKFGRKLVKSRDLERYCQQTKIGRLKNGSKSKSRKES